MEISDVKPAIAKKQIVEVDGIQYYPVAYRLTLDEGDNAWRHTMELRDLKANSCLVHAPLKNIKIIERKVYKDGKVIEV